MAFKLELFLLLSTLAFASLLDRVRAGDPDITSDFLVPPNVTSVNGTFFTFIGLRDIFLSAPPPAFKATKASLAEFPALDGQSVSLAILQYPVGSVNPPHTHPRSAELLYVLMGTLGVGFVDTKNNLFTQTLQTGDLFVFPKGLVHFQYNCDPDKSATAISAFGSANAGTVSIPGTVFNTSISDDVLAKSFKTDIATIQKIKSGFAPQP
ncbi:OLC1v1026402C1 [Oldenlandia corymbosa var. corymbosa]|uniref:Germin-like protein n=1 Tax=Oldenlandia corymbosa var. corymbosa TaxID=529605 RepID=A0AAV1C797_OLDCO|nr:OLC1v1026402C1 [Oldenlandia corymbosa var. corymbosa]